MFKIISMQAEDGSQIDVPFLANAATSYRYKTMFKQDLLVLFQTFEHNGTYDIDFVEQLAYIMAMQAKAKTGEIDLTTINVDSMVSWLEQFGSFAIYNKAQEILSVYLDNTTITSSEKKKARKQTVN